MSYPTRFIAASGSFSEWGKPVPEPYLRKSFSLKNRPVSASVVISALGFYRLWINGQEVTRGHMSPYISNPDHYVFYDTYDVLPYVHEGENVIGILLGNGLQNSWGGYIWDFDEVPWRGAPKVAARATIGCSDGTEILVETDETFRTHDSPVRWDDERVGEGYDARCEIPGWNEPGFDDSGWSFAIKAPDIKGQPVPNGVRPILTETELAPVKIIRDGDGFIYDFGVNYTGVTRLRISGAKPGQKIVIDHGEVLVDGHFYNGNLYFSGHKKQKNKEAIVQRAEYVCRGGGTEEYMPSFTYYGFRYARVRGIEPEQATKDLLTYVVKHSALTRTSGFSCSDTTLSKLYENCIRSDLSNFWFFPTDCPHREKNGWTGDIAVSSEQFHLNFDMIRDMNQWLMCFRRAMHEDGLSRPVIPNHEWGDDTGPCWDSALVFSVYYMYQYTMDRKIIEDNCEAIRRMLGHFSDKRGEDGIVRGGLGDWCSPQFPTATRCPDEFALSAIAFACCNYASRLFEIIGAEEEKKYADKLGAELRTSIRKAWMDLSACAVKGTGETSQAMALYYGLYDKEEYGTAFKVLLERIRQNENRLDTGILGVRVLFDVLTQNGYTDLALELMLKPGGPSFGQIIAQGLTTMGEDYFGTGEGINAKALGMGSLGIGSLNHHFFGHISAWMIKELAGIHPNPDLDDVNAFVLDPHFASILQSCSAWHVFPAGRLEVEWKKTGDGYAAVNVRIQGELHGKIRLGEKLEPLASGTYRLPLDR
ncbi:MAG: family 78 glycoside hydrolase catalytic domain [Clostridia bacterium]|nr:family 78 glycoside hydrolase catalytic domain [Clostridia bacterium]